MLSVCHSGAFTPESDAALEVGICKSTPEGLRPKGKSAHDGTRGAAHFKKKEPFLPLVSVQTLEIFKMVSMREMLEAGCHFGHQTRFWNPKMAQ